MSIQQVSVFIENRPGRLAGILGFLAQEGVGLRAYSFAEASDFGILRMLVDDTAKAVAALKRGGYTARANEVLGIYVPDEAGAAAEAFRVLGDAGVNVEYTYAFAVQGRGEAFVLLRVDDNEKAADLLARAGFRLAQPASLF